MMACRASRALVPLEATPGDKEDMYARLGDDAADYKKWEDACLALEAQIRELVRSREADAQARCATLKKECVTHAHARARLVVHITAIDLAHTRHDGRTSPRNARTRHTRTHAHT